MPSKSVLNPTTTLLELIALINAELPTRLVMLIWDAVIVPAAISSDVMVPALISFEVIDLATNLSAVIVRCVSISPFSVSTLLACNAPDILLSSYTSIDCHGIQNTRNMTILDCHITNNTCRSK